MRILHIYKDFEPSKGGGGVARHIEGLCMHLSPGNDVTVAALVCETRSDKIRAEILNYSRLPELIARADIVHVHGARNISALLAGFVAFVKRKPLFYTPHCYYDDDRPFKQFLKKIWDHTAESFLLHYSRVTFLLAHSWIDYVTQNIGGIRNPLIVPNCVDISAIQVLPRCADTGDLAGNPSILYVGRLDPIKCIDHVITAMTQPSLQAAMLHIVGKGPDRARLEQLATTLNIADRVHFYGFQDDMAVTHLASRANVFVLPSAQEGLPTVLLEMLLRRVPVVASDIAGNLAILEPLSLTHCTYPFGNTDALAATLAQISANETVKDTTLENLKECFTWSTQAKHIESQYRASLQ